LAINPAYAPALLQLGFTLIDQVRFGWAEDQATTYEAALECAARDLAADPNSFMAYMIVGYVRLFQRRHEDALVAGEKAIALGPNSSDVYHMAGMSHGYAGDFRKAARYEEQAQRLSPLSRNESMVDEARARFHMGGSCLGTRNRRTRSDRETTLADRANGSCGGTLESRQRGRGPHHGRENAG